jgi:hypothetical protein
MTDDDLRVLIRQAVARHLNATASPGAVVAPASVLASAPSPQPAAARSLHPSHYQYLTLVNVGEACLIEPTVSCNHCGYCKSHGH